MPPEHSIPPPCRLLRLRGLAIEECPGSTGRQRVVGPRPQPGLPLLFTNGKGLPVAAQASALGNSSSGCPATTSGTTTTWATTSPPGFRPLPAGALVSLADGGWPADLLTPELQAFYNPQGSIPAAALVDMNSGNGGRGICAIPYVRERDGAEVFFPVNIISNLYVSTAWRPAIPGRGPRPGVGGNPRTARQVQGHRRGSLPARRAGRDRRPHPGIAAGIAGCGRPASGVLVKDASWAASIR